MSSMGKEIIRWLLSPEPKTAVQFSVPFRLWINLLREKKNMLDGDQNSNYLDVSRSQNHSPVFGSLSTLDEFAVVIWK